MNDKHEFQRLIESTNDHKPVTYSGRGMNGNECVAVCTDYSALEFFADVLDAWGRSVENPQIGADVIANMMREARTDRLGRQIVIYFPGVPFVE